ncbi:g1215 [Coccomyxa viridis]|uniref:G1215 protein n=1 Tax=Coccomyxa viridis TaxID=1274662 RepID=A0ABP1FHM4_9CHLO
MTDITGAAPSRPSLNNTLPRNRPEPEQLLEAAEGKAGCSGYLDTKRGVYWPSDYPLLRGGNFVFTPHPPGVVDTVKSCVARLARAFKTPTSNAKSSGIKTGVYQTLLTDASE